MAKKMKLKKVPATTENITTGIINLLLSEGHSASRINTEGQFYNVEPNNIIFRHFPSLHFHLKKLGLLIGRYRPSGARKGVFDVIACCQIRRYGISLGTGQLVAIDIKNAGDRIRPDQIKFKAEIEAAGGIAFTVSSYGEFLTWYGQSPYMKVK